MIIAHVPELAMEEGPERDRRSALRAMRNCGVIRVQIGAVPRGYRILQRDGHCTAKRAPIEGMADCRLTDEGRQLAARLLK